MTAAPDPAALCTGNYARTAFERRKGINKYKGYVTSVDDIHLGRLMEILQFFQRWEQSLRESDPASSEWKKHFITHQSWYDLRLTILSFVALSRYLLAEPSTFREDTRGGRGPRYISPRDFSQVRKCVLRHIARCVYNSMHCTFLGN